MEYSDDMSIDEDSLDLECLDQPDLMLKYSELCEKAKKHMDEEKHELDLVQAKIDLRVRTHPDKFGITVKVVEAVITNAIIQQPNWQEANTKYLQARYEYGILKGAVVTVEHKKTSLELLVKLYNGQYFAGPSVPRDLSAERKRKQGNVDKGVASKMKRTRN